MSYQRNKAQEAMLKLLEELTDGKENSEMYKQIFNRMSDTEFTAWMEKMAKEQEWMFLVAPPYNREFLDFERTIKVGESYGINLFAPLDVVDENLGLKYQTKPALTMYVPVRRASQIGSTKISVPKDSKKQDILTGQVTGDSQASAVSLPEFMILSSSGLENALIELISVRGGDQGALAALDGLLMQEGRVSLHETNQYSTGVQSTKTMATFLTCMHLSSNI